MTIEEIQEPLTKKQKIHDQDTSTQIVEVVEQAVEVVEQDATALVEVVEQETTTQMAESVEADKKEPKKAKRKVAVLLGYCGTGYQGMQLNPGTNTIELELHKAFAASGVVSKDNQMDPKKIGFVRAARTDKGVHALGQCVSLKMIIEDGNEVERINNHLPEQIRIWNIVRVTNSFHAQHNCDSRYYEYLMPTYVLRSAIAELYPRSTIAKENSINFVPPDYSKMSESEIFSYLNSRESIPANERDMETIRKYRIDSETLEKLQETLRLYQGTQNYHNFTIGKSFSDSSAKRYIMSFECDKPFVRNNVEWLSLKVHGQSFMLHQIRKMVGLAILIVKTRVPNTLVQRAFEQVKLNIPKAPGLGLLLDRTVFTGYNRKWASDKNPVCFNSANDKITQFKEKHVYEKMIQEELKSNEFENWCRAIDSHHKEFEWFLTDDGQIDPGQKPPHIHNSQ